MISNQYKRKNRQEVLVIITDVQRAKQGDKLAYQRLIEENKVYFFNIAIAILKNESDAGDAIGEMVMIGFREIKNLRKAEFFRTWMTRILINECNKILRTRGRIIPFDNNINAEEEPVVNNEEIIDLKIAVNLLDSKLKDVVILFYYNGLSLKEISKILKIPVGTVKSRLSVAKQKLYNILSNEGKVISL